jgi:hypothetical protein
MTSGTHRARRARANLAAAMRASLATLLVLLLYYMAPMRGSDGPVALRLFIGLGVYASLTAWQLHAISKSDRPGLRAVEALATGIPLFLVVFASAYYALDGSAGEVFTQSLNKTDALYFTITVFSSVGFGDIAPVSQVARVIAMVQMVADLIMFGAVARVMLDAVKSAKQRRLDVTNG